MALLEQVLAFDYGPKTRLAEWLDTKLGKGEDYHLIDSQRNNCWVIKVVRYLTDDEMKECRAFMKAGKTA